MDDKLQGKTLGKYRIESLIGKGGMASVYLATHEQLGSKVAIKVLPASFAQQADMAERFLREARTAARLTHPSIVRVHDVDQIENISFFVMDFVEGESLKSLLRQQHPLDEKEIYRISLSVLSALTEAHSQGVVHRDIKPDNIMIDRHGHALVTDFGIAKTTQDSDLTRTGTFIGTVRYASPEQIQGQTVDPRSEIYSWGVVMYEMATGSPAFQGSEPTAILYKIINETPPPVSTLNPALSPKLAAIITKAMAKDAGERFQTAGEMQAAILETTDGLTSLRRAHSGTKSPDHDDATRLLSEVAPHSASTLQGAADDPTRVLGDEDATRLLSPDERDATPDQARRTLRFGVLAALLLLPVLTYGIYHYSRPQPPVSPPEPTPAIVLETVSTSLNEHGKPLEPATQQVAIAPAVTTNPPAVDTPSLASAADPTVSAKSATTTNPPLPATAHTVTPDSLTTPAQSQEAPPVTVAALPDNTPPAATPEEATTIPEKPELTDVTIETSTAKGAEISVWTKKKEYRVGEKLQVHFRAKEDCYVYLYHESARGEVTLIFPNEFDGENFIEGGKQYTIPDDSYGFDFIIQPPLGTERIKALVTREKQVAAGWRNMGVRGLTVKAKALEDSTTLRVLDASAR